MACGRNLTSLSIQQKLEILDSIKKGNRSKKELSAIYKCDQSTIRRILQQEEKLRRIVHENGDISRKRLRKGKFEQIDDAVANWFYQMRLKNTTITGTMLMNEAREFAVKLDVPEFKPSNGWLSRWKIRNNILFRKTEDGRGTLEAGTCKRTEFTNELPEIVVQGHSERDIFIGEETGLLYKALPDGIEVNSNDNEEENRITLLLLCNMDGSEKEVIAIGKQTNPNCFWGKEPPIQYFSHDKSWMTPDIFNRILERFNDRMREQERRVTLFVEHTACHKLNIEMVFSHLSVRYIPAKTTPQVKPQGFIRSFKSHYRNIILRNHFIFLESGHTSREFVDSLTLLDALRIVKNSWELVHPFVIKNCFREAGFLRHNSKTYKAEEEQIPDVPMILRSDFDNFVDCDSNLKCYGELNEESIPEKLVSNEDEIDSKEDLSLLPEVPTQREALAALNTLRSFFHFQGEDLNHIEAVEDQLFEFSKRTFLQSKFTSCVIKKEPLD